MLFRLLLLITFLAETSVLFLLFLLGTAVYDFKNSYYSLEDIARKKSNNEIPEYNSPNPIGGGIGYDKPVTCLKKHMVTNKKEFLSALKHAKPGDGICIKGSSQIDLSDVQNLALPAGVTIYSDRGTSNSEGALIISNISNGFSFLFIAGGKDIRITGIRLKGPHLKRWTIELSRLYERDGNYSCAPIATGIKSFFPIEVDNCELYGWSHSPLYLVEGASGSYIHHNYIHHNQRQGEGYGVSLDGASALIEANLFEWNKHHISGTGIPGTGYEARYNIAEENVSESSFDMHGGLDRMEKENTAGDYFYIHHNVFKNKHVSSINIRGTPAKKSFIESNVFFVSGAEAIKIPISQKMVVRENTYLHTNKVCVAYKKLLKNKIYPFVDYFL